VETVKGVVRQQQKWTEREGQVSWGYWGRRIHWEWFQSDRSWFEGARAQGP